MTESKRAPDANTTGSSSGPVPQTPRALRALPTEQHAWDLGWGWEVYFVAVMVLVSLIGLLSPGTPWLSAALPGALLALYLMAGRRLVKSDDWERGNRLLFVALVVLMLLPAITLDGNVQFILVAVAPLLFMVTGLRYAVAAMALILLVPAPVRGLLGWQDWTGVGLNLLIHSVILAYAMWFGTWMYRIVEQSYERYALIEELQHTREEADRLSQEAGAVAEREHLAREMHDTLAQGFTSIITLTQAVESELDSEPETARRHLALMRETAAENLAETRAMVAARQQIRVADESLDASVRRIAERLGQELGISVTADVTGTPEELPNHHQVCLLRTAQEALANLRKHAGADGARVTLAYTDVGVRLTVADDGNGFDPARPANGNGLANMRHRAESVGGLLEVDSVPGTGTTVRLSLPHDETEADADPGSGTDERREEPAP
ncbi:sensor histidine kinase [Nocardiopsis oceani]